MRPISSRPPWQIWKTKVRWTWTSMGNQQQASWTHMKDTRAHRHHKYANKVQQTWATHAGEIWSTEQHAEINDMYKPTPGRHEKVRKPQTACNPETYMKTPTAGRQDQYAHTTAARQEKHETPHSRLKGQTWHNHRMQDWKQTEAKQQAIMTNQKHEQQVDLKEYGSNSRPTWNKWKSNSMQTGHTWNKQ